MGLRCSGKQQPALCGRPGELHTSSHHPPTNALDGERVHQDPSCCGKYGWQWPFLAYIVVVACAVVVLKGADECLQGSQGFHIGFVAGESMF